MVKSRSVTAQQAVIRDYFAVAFQRVVQVGLLIGQLALVLFVIVVPLVMLARYQRGIFWVLALGLIAVLVRFLLKRKYQNMIRLDRSDTRVDVQRRSVKHRFLYRVLLRPALFLLIVLCYMVFVHSLTFPGPARIFGSLGGFVMTFFLVAWVRYLRRAPGAVAAKPELPVVPVASVKRTAVKGVPVVPPGKKSGKAEPARKKTGGTTPVRGARGTRPARKRP